MRFDGDAYDKVFPRPTVKDNTIPDDERMVDDNPDVVDDEVVDTNTPEDNQPDSDIPEDNSNE